MAFDLSGKKLIVTGAGKGIGRAICVALYKSGCKVYALSRTKSTLDTLKEECPGIVTLTKNLANWEETRRKLEKLEPVDGLVNNAGIVDVAPALKWRKDQLERLISINLYSAINCSQVVAKRMVASGIKGSIVNISSILSEGAIPGCLGYSVAKAGMDMATKQFALELGPHGIRVNSVQPAVVLTDMTKNPVSAEEIVASNLHPIICGTPMGRMLTMNEAVAPVLYFLSDHSAMVTGTLHTVDGGLGCCISTGM